MSHLVASVAPQAGAHTVKAYAGFGILGANIPATGDNGGSPVLNDGVQPSSEYYWRITSQPSAGTLTIFSDLSCLFDPGVAPDGDYLATYQLFEDRVSVGTAPLAFHVGPHNLTLSPSQQVNSGSPLGVLQTHLAAVLGGQQANAASPIAVTQTHFIAVSASQQSNTGVSASVSQSSTTFISTADSIQINQSTAMSALVTHLVNVAGGQQANVGGSVAVLQAIVGGITTADSQQLNQSSAASILQTHFVGILGGQQVNRGLPLLAGDSSVVGNAVRVKQGGAYFDSSPYVKVAGIYRPSTVVSKI